jgi:hypothetical protein
VLEVVVCVCNASNQNTGSLGYLARPCLTKKKREEKREGERGREREREKEGGRAKEGKKEEKERPSQCAPPTIICKSLNQSIKRKTLAKSTYKEL